LDERLLPAEIITQADPWARLKTMYAIKRNARHLTLVGMIVFLGGSLCGEAPSTENPARSDAHAAEALALSSYKAGDYQTAERTLREWLASEPVGSLSHLAAQSDLGHLLREEGRNQEAHQLFAGIIGSPDLPWRIQLNALTGLADADENSGDLKTGIDEWNAALDLARTHGDSASESEILRGLGRAWLSTGSMARAEPLLRRSLQIAENDQAAHPLNLASSLGAMAEYYRMENKLSLAEEAGSRALSIGQAQLGESHPQVAVFMDMMSDVYSAKGEWDTARDYAVRAENEMRRQLGSRSVGDAAALAELALVEQRAKMFEDAALHYDACLSVLRQYSDLQPVVKLVMRRYERVLKELHRRREAKALDAEIKSFR
jgi:tetratricopeptide (TPR) repeat protein